MLSKPRTAPVHEGELRRPVPLTWQFLILLASIGVLLCLTLSLLVPLPPEVKRTLDLADTVICFIFLADFFLLLYLHRNRRRYLLTWGWIDFLSSIPLLDPFRWGRIARLVRLLRLFRGLRGSAGLLRRLFRHKRETTVLAIVLILLSVATFSSVAILVAEEGGRIDTAEEALWWTLTTMTTVGYGDLVPETTLGRAVAALTMFAGIGVFGAFTALIASLLVRPQKDSADFDALVCQLREQQDALRRIEEKLGTGDPTPPDP